MKNIITAQLLGVVLLTSCIDTTQSDTTQSTRQAQTQSQTRATSTTRVLTIDSNITPKQYDAYLAQLRQQDIVPLLGLPGNVLVVERVTEHFKPREMALPTTMHSIDEQGMWTPTPRQQNPWHMVPQPAQDLPLSPRASQRIQQNLTGILSDRPMGLKIARRLIQHQVKDGIPLQRDHVEPVAPALERAIIGLGERKSQQQTAQTREHIEAKINWASNHVASLKSRNNNADKKALRRTALMMFFPESTGTGNENWTAAEVEDEIVKATSSLAALVRVAPPRAALFFQFIIAGHGHPINEISVEPTNDVDKNIWVNELLINFGLDLADEDDPAHANSKVVEAFLVQQLGSTYATNAFIVRDEEEPHAQFSNSTNSGWPHASGNGHFVNNSRFNARTYVHEYLHTVNAADQYAAGNGDTPCKNRLPTGHERTIEAGSPTSQTNGNHVNCPAHSIKVPSIMNSHPIHTLGQTQSRPLLDWYTRAAIGWGNSSQVLAGIEIEDPVYPPGGSYLGYTPTPYAGIGSTTSYQDYYVEPRAFRYMFASEPYYTRFRRCFKNHFHDDLFWAPLGTALVDVHSCMEADTHYHHAPNIGYSEIDMPSPGIFAHHEGHVQVQIKTYKRHDNVDLTCDESITWFDGLVTPALALERELLCFVRDIPHGRTGFIHSNAYYIEHHPSCAIGTYDGANCYLGTASAGTSPFIHDGKLYTTPSYVPSCSVGAYDGSNCYLGTASPGTSPFIYEGKLYTTALPGNICPLGWYDGANCHVGTPAPGTSPFLLGNKLYTTASLTPTCPLGTYDGSNCHVGTPAPGTSPFLLGNKLYTTSKLGCDLGWYHAAGCYMGSPPAGRHAVVDDRHFYYSPF